MTEKNNPTYVAVTDQAGHQIGVYDLDMRCWDASRALVWRWSAKEDNGFTGLTHAWGLPTDAKVRCCDRWDGQWMVVTDSLGLAAIVPYPSGDARKWAQNVGGNPHSAELLPDGNIAVAASTGGWVRVYASSQGADAAAYAEYPFPGAHGVEWDAERGILWALGDDHLVALEVSGTPDEPHIRETLKVPLPSPGGHDVHPVYGDRDRLWISTRAKVYQYIKSTGQFDENYEGSEYISRAHVKSVGDAPSGIIVTAAPDGVPRPQTGAPHNDWCTETIDCFHRASVVNRAELADAHAQLLLPGVALYKARVWIQRYSPASCVLR